MRLTKEFESPTRQEWIDGLNTLSKEQLVKELINCSDALDSRINKAELRRKIEEYKSTFNFDNESVLFKEEILKLIE